MSVLEHCTMALVPRWSSSVFVARTAEEPDDVVGHFFVVVAIKRHSLAAFCLVAFFIRDKLC